MTIPGITRCVVLFALVTGLVPRPLSADETADSLKHTDLPGEIRLRTVRDLVAAYRPLESRAERGGEEATLWGRVGEAAIAAAWQD